MSLDHPTFDGCTEAHSSPNWPLLLQAALQVQAWTEEDDKSIAECCETHGLDWNAVFHICYLLSTQGMVAKGFRFGMVPIEVYEAILADTIESMIVGILVGMGFSKAKEKGL